ncbi:class I SAM-dependent DNA methyltransferase [Limosilactobacillus fastidiosus]|uniref:Class I SAM-dependent methyltransferase n=1 Tax=Limosilactobacillus fastidiosus TaxID=2759855 RepID=A0A7W3YD41_9LACO|nr:class I SAM-dependent methyltransferase [Limosilactobacillus fastidiosus]MBB1063695.1 class I SAM-dependent methyltransferase [Limosilactobacillus fastidiosus]MBB1086776.1 class I SAM-dependent methyltransferase [Limosilactobacillus fastidiosus]MCD7084270.1 class I SAM-dependent methyltransferase [Limosilactobacillus fastidiosus]MCD7085497.1 class I SAM-dependent methyltransferase [Limosilactobacillus fastidiosus]MCD7114728.1 class I SAM-dependent methyltransferase [Limosilactobacillus fast
MIYQSFAQLYDQLFDQELYKRWLDFTLKQGQPVISSKCLDLAGGAGRLAVMLAQKQVNVTVADFSSEMLSLARQHADEAGVELELIEADMRELNRLPKYDLITCYADSLNYLEDGSAVQVTFRQVYEHLTANGIFLFDMISPYKTDIVYPGYMYNYEDDNHQRAFMWRSFMDDDVEHGVIHDLTFFNQLNDGKYQRVSETHFERAYSMSELEDSLKIAGFRQIEISSDFGQKKATDEDERWFFKCRK